MFRVLCFATPQNAPFLPFSGSSLMTGACHHLWPVLVLIEDPSKAQKAFFRLPVQRYNIFGQNASFHPDFLCRKWCKYLINSTFYRFLSELYCRNIAKNRKIRIEGSRRNVKKRSLRSRSLRSLRKWESVILSYSIYKYIYIYYRKMFFPRNLNDLNDLDLNDRIEYFCFKDL